MFDPLAALESKISEIKAEVCLAVRIAILREDANVVLSRLSTLDPDRPERYLSAIQAMK